MHEGKTGSAIAVRVTPRAGRDRITEVLDDGTIITESIAICRYFEVLQPEPPLFGVGAKEIALVLIWMRWPDLAHTRWTEEMFAAIHDNYLLVDTVGYTEIYRPKP